MPAGHVYAERQFQLSVPDSTPERRAKGNTILEEGDAQTTLRGGNTTATFDNETGLLVSLKSAGKELLLAPLTPNFWRAPTDNDFGNYMPDWGGVWEQAGRNRTLESRNVIETESNRVMIKVRYAFASDNGDTLAHWTATYTVSADGSIHVQNDFVRNPDLPVMPRVGMNVELVHSLDNVEWFGRGPHENYSDRKESANVGRYTNKVADHYVPYMRPQENGYKTDVRWVSLSDASTSLLVTADELLSFGVSHNRLTDFVPPVKIAITSEDGECARKNDERVNVHVNDVVPRELISFDIDLGQMGVGGDDSWGKRTLQEYSLNEASYSYGFTLAPNEK